jgi:hypothetical protein
VEEDRVVGTWDVVVRSKYRNVKGYITCILALVCSHDTVVNKTVVLLFLLCSPSVPPTPPHVLNLFISRIGMDRFSFRF